MLNGFDWGVSEFKDPCVFLLGGFDGLHAGHKKLVEFAKTFSLPVGMMVMSGGKGEELFTKAEKTEIFKNAGIRFVVPILFTEEIKNTDKATFLDLILKNINVKAFVCGKDFRFGKGAEGTPDFIREYTGVPTYDLDILLQNGKKIGVANVKELLKTGDVSTVNRLLCEDYFIRGTVEEGRKVGRLLGFPTANIAYPEGKFMLKEGVYAVHGFIDGKKYVGIANVGACPTFNVSIGKIEVSFHGFSGDLYGRELSVYFDSFIRGIKTFPSKDDLIDQLKKDMQTALSRA